MTVGDPQQNPEELAWLLEQISGVSSILEVGSCHGHNLAAMARVAKAGAVIRSIDIGGEHSPSLHGTIQELTDAGYDAQCLIQDSHADQSGQWAAQWAPYDFVFIDGDHTYSGTKLDWMMYGPLGRQVGFHDIGRRVPEIACGLVWDEIVGTHFTKSIQKRAGDMGIGIVLRDGPPARQD